MEMKEAIKILKDFHDKSALFSVRTALETLHPELKESEDERIRKELIKVFSNREKYLIDQSFGDITVSEILTWLEKQGESSDQIHFWTEEEIEPIISDYLRGAEHYGGMIGRLRCLKPKSLEKQGTSYTKSDVDDAYLKGLSDAKNELEKQGNSPIKWNKNTEGNKPQVNHSVLMKTTHGIAEGEWQGEYWHQYKWAGIVRDSDVLSWMELSDLDKQGDANKEYWRGYREGKQEILDKYAELEKQGEEEQLYIRFGEIPTDEKSKIYRGEIEVGTENGVSVYPAFKTNEGDIVLGLNLPITKTTLYTQQHLIEYDDRPCYLVKGDYVGKDTDGQTLINNVSIIEKIDTYRLKEKKQGEQKPTLRERYKNIAESEWFKKTHEGMSVSDDEKVDNVNKIEQKPAWSDDKKLTDVNHEYFSELLENNDSEDINDYAYQVAYCMSHDWIEETATWDDVQKACKLGAEWKEKHWNNSSTAWSEEDEEHYQACLQYFDAVNPDMVYYKDYQWLKSLKERIGE